MVILQAQKMAIKTVVNSTILKNLGYKQLNINKIQIVGRKTNIQ